MDQRWWVGEDALAFEVLEQLGRNLGERLTGQMRKVDVLELVEGHELYNVARSLLLFELQCLVITI